METKVYKCIRKEYNGNMGGNECYDNKTMFFFDRDGIVNIGDSVKIEIHPTYYGKIWINDIIVKTK